MYLTVTLEEIDENEYHRIVDMNFKTTQEIREELLLEMLERGM